MKLPILALALAMLVSCSTSLPKVTSLSLPSSRTFPYTDNDCEFLAFDSLGIIVQITRHQDMLTEQWLESCISLSWCSKKSTYYLGYPDSSIPYPYPTFTCLPH
jgi:hypothetical protein